MFPLKIIKSQSGLRWKYGIKQGILRIYYRSKIVEGIYDDRLLVKPVKSAISYMLMLHHFS